MLSLRIVGGSDPTSKNVIPRLLFHLIVRLHDMSPTLIEAKQLVVHSPIMSLQEDVQRFSLLNSAPSPACTIKSDKH